MNPRKLYLFASTASLLLAAACSDSNSSNGISNEALTTEDIPESSSSVIESSSEIVDISDTSVVIQEDSLIDSSIEYVTLDINATIENCTTKPYSFASGIQVYCNDSFLGNILEDTDTSPYDASLDYTDFVSIQKVLNALEETQRVVFLLRHGDRQSGSGSESLLTGLGKYQARSVGEKLSTEESIFFAHSDFKRTEETAENIAIGKGQAEFAHKTVSELSGSWYILDKETLSAYAREEINEQHVFAGYTYENKFADAFYDLKTRSDELTNILKENFTATHRISVAISHDQLILPYLVYLTNGQIDLNYSQTGNWLNFLAGVALIVDANDNVKFVPVKGLDSGLL